MNLTANRLLCKAEQEYPPIDLDAIERVARLPRRDTSQSRWERARFIGSTLGETDDDFVLDLLVPQWILEPLLVRHRWTIARLCPVFQVPERVVYRQARRLLGLA